METEVTNVPTTPIVTEASPRATVPLAMLRRNLGTVLLSELTIKTFLKKSSSFKKFPILNVSHGQNDNN
jgi:hypothetical protein